LQPQNPVLTNRNSMNIASIKQTRNIVDSGKCVILYGTARARQYLQPVLLGVLFLLVFSATAQEKLPVDCVNPLIDTHASRWDFFASACRPSGMVNLSPDTSLGNFWNCGYIYGDTKIQCFSHIHGWQLYGVAVMPATGEMRGQLGMDAYASDFSHESEVVRPGYYKVKLDTYGITAELTSTTRVGFHRYQFPRDKPAHVIIDTGASLMGDIASSEVRRVSDTELVGQAVMAPMMRRSKSFTVYFVIQFSQPFSKFGGWTNGTLLPDGVETVEGIKAGAFVSFTPTPPDPVLMKVAISYVSIDGARTNLQAELPHWDFDRVVRESGEDWNRWLGRVEVDGGTPAQRTKFYTDLWHTLLGRTIVSDVDGRYCDMTGPQPVVRRVRLDGGGKPSFPHYNFDSLWGSQWSLAILWSFVYPEVMDGTCNTLVDMYHDGGLIPRGPSGGNYTYVMIGDEAAPFIAAAYNKGIRNYDVNQAYEGLRKNALPGGIRDHAGYEQGTNACGGGMKYYIERGYVPQGIEGEGMHKDGASMTLEYAYEDWCLSQLAQALGKEADARWLLERSFNYTNLWDASVKYMRPRLKDGSWLPGFEPVGPEATNGFCEANSAIDTHFVPQDVPGLIRLFGGSEEYLAALNRQFELAVTNRFVAEPNKHGLQWVDYDNEPSLSMAFMFNVAGAPWLSQKWVRAVEQQVYGDTTPYGGYIGDDDEGQMAAVSALMAIGLFDVKGGADIKPAYQINAPIFDQITIHLATNYFAGGTFTIKTLNNGAKNIYIQSVKLDGHPLNRCRLEHADLVKGGELEIKLGPTPNKKWGVE
jgi:predicted alpha-1,2-mannosidase